MQSRERERESKALRLTNAFTLAEVLIVLTILGIIAAVSMVTLKPAEFRAKGMKVAAQKVMYDIDTATTQILLNDLTMEGDVVKIPVSQCTSPNLKTLYSKYLATINATYLNDTSQISYLTLKNRTLFAVIGFGGNSGYVDGVQFPGKSSNKTVYNVNCGVIEFNIDLKRCQYGTNCFKIPLNRNGIAY